VWPWMLHRSQQPDEQPIEQPVSLKGTLSPSNF